jgi:hypothetical protein
MDLPDWSQNWQRTSYWVGKCSSLTNLSEKTLGIGNPLAILRHQIGAKFGRFDVRHAYFITAYAVK